MANNQPLHKIYKIESIGYDDMIKKVQAVIKEVAALKKEYLDMKKAMGTGAPNTPELDALLKKIQEKSIAIADLNLKIKENVQAELQSKLAQQESAKTTTNSAGAFLRLAKETKDAITNAKNLAIEYGAESAQALAAAKAAEVLKQKFAEANSVIKGGTKELNVDRAKEAELIRRRNLEIKAQVLADLSAEGSVEQLRAQLRLAQIDYDRLSQAERDNTAVGQKAKDKVDELTIAVKKLEEGTDRYFRSVGNYAKAYNPLNNSISQISRELPSLANGFQTFAMAIGNNIAAAQDAITGAIERNRLLRAEGQATVPVWKQLGSAFVSWNVLLSVGVALFTVYAKEIKNFFTGLVKGSQAASDMKNNLQNVNEVMSAANKEAGAQITTLKALYDSATNANIPLSERSKYVKELKEQFPSYFKSISDEIILNGGAKKSYEDLTIAILESSRARAAQSKLDAIEAQRLDVIEQRQKIKTATVNQIKDKNNKVVVGGIAVQFSEEDRVKFIKSKEKFALADQDAKEADLQRQAEFLVKYVGGEKKLADAIVNANKNNDKTYAGARLTAADKDRLSFLDARMNTELSKEETRITELRKLHDLSLDEERQYVTSIEAITTKYLQLKIGSFGDESTLNAKQLETLASLKKAKSDIELKSQKDLEALHKREFAERQKAYQDQLDLEVKAATDKNQRVQDDPLASSLNKLNAKLKADKSILTAQQVFHSNMTGLEDDFKEKSKKNAEDREQAIKNSNARIVNDTRSTFLKAQEILQQNELDNALLTFQVAVDRVYKDTNLTIDQQASKIADLTREYQKQTDNIKIDALKSQIQPFLLIQALGLPLPDQAIELIKKYWDLVNAANAKAKEEASKKQAGRFSIGKAVKGLFGFDTDPLKGLSDTQKQVEAAQFAANAYQDAFSSAADSMRGFYDLYFQKQNEAIDQNAREQKSILDKEEERLLAQAQSSAEAESIKKRYQIRSEQIDKEAFEKKKKVSLQQAAISYATGVVQAWAAAAPYLANPLTAGFALPAVLATTAALTATYFLQRASIMAQKFAFGGKVQPMKNGVITAAPNIPVQPNGDNVLATVKPGEVILNKVQQALLGGPKTFASIGVPGFGYGGQVPSFNDYGGSLGANLQAPVFRSSSSNVYVTNSNDTGLIEEVKALGDKFERHAEETSKRFERIKVGVNIHDINQMQNKVQKQSDIGTL